MAFEMFFIFPEKGCVCFLGYERDFPGDFVI